MLQPMSGGNTTRLAMVSSAAPTRIDTETHHQMLRGGTANQTNAIVATTATPGSTSRARRRCTNMPGRQVIRRCFFDYRCGFGLFDQQRHLATWSSLEIRYWPSSDTIVTRKR